MADIQAYLDAIENAVYGEDVRGSIHDAIEIINEVGEVVITAGTAVTSASSSTEGFFENSLYFNTNTNDLWQCNGSGWTLLGNLKGDQGDQGNPGQAATIAVGTVTKGDNASVVNSGTSSAAVFDFVLPKGDPGPAGVNTWGSLTGDIDDQTDLANALDGTYLGAEAAIDATVGWVSSNLASDMDASGGIANGKVTVTKDTGTALVYNEASYANAGARIKLYGIPKNKDCKLTFTATEGSGGTAKIGTFAAYWLQGGYIVSSTISKTVTQTGDFYEISFNSGNDPYEYIGIDLYCTGDAASVGSVTYSEIMVRDADAPYNGYSQMHESVSDVITDVYGVMGVNGAKNRLPIPDSLATSTNPEGVTFTVNRDSKGRLISIDVSGTPSANCAYQLYRGKIDAGTYKATKVGAVDMNIYSYAKSANILSMNATTDNQSVTVDSSDANDIYVLLYLFKDRVYDTTVYPMIRDARDTNPDFEPYAMTNRELTDAVTEYDSACTSLIGTSVYNTLVKIGQLVQLDLRMSGVTAEAFNDVLAVIPSGYRPKQTTRVTIYNKTDGTMHIGIAGTEGNLTAEANISNKELCWHAMWFTS